MSGAPAAGEEQKREAVLTHSRQSEQFARSYIALAEDSYRTCFAYSRRRLDAALVETLPSNGQGLRLLDVGCGTGHHMAALRQRGFEVVGVDGSCEMLEHARGNNPGADLRQADVEKLPFPDAQFDVAISIEVLRYLPRLDRCLGEIARVLKPGGLCLATAAPLLNLNGYWLVNRIANAMPVGNLVRLKQFFVTSHGLRVALQDAGFRNVRVHGVYLGPVNWVERVAPKALPSVLRAWEPIDAALADRWPWRELANMFLVKGTKAARLP